MTIPIIGADDIGAERGLKENERVSENSFADLVLFSREKIFSEKINETVTLIIINDNG